MALLNRSELYERLSQNVVDVHFTKVNGERRVLVCTLDPTRIEECPSPSADTTPKSEDSGRMNVWDLEKHDWRSFLIENVNAVITPSLTEPDDE